MTPLQRWLSKPRTRVRIDATLPWTAWTKMLRRPFGNSTPDSRPRIEVLDRLSLGGKKSLLLIAIAERHLLVGVGEDAAPSIVGFESRCQSAAPESSPRSRRHAARGRRKAR